MSWLRDHTNENGVVYNLIVGFLRSLPEPY